MLFGITRQAYYQYYWNFEEVQFEHSLVVSEVLKIRKDHPRMGGRKLYELLESFMIEHQIKMGRDTLFDLLAANSLLVRRRKRGVYTTQSSHWFRKHSNLIIDFIPQKSNQLWVSDITYWKVGSSFLYLSLVTDTFSHKVVGYQLSKTLEAKATVIALKMAIQNSVTSLKGLIHHSDRGVQYCCTDYVSLLKQNEIRISMTENGDPLENAIAERINGILKDEYLECYQPKAFKEANEVLKRSVELYNNHRPHMSIGMKTPSEIHTTNQKTKQLWKNYYSKNCKIVNPIQD